MEKRPWALLVINSATVFLIILLANISMAADKEWKVTAPRGALFSCQGVTKVCVALNGMLVKKTPNDPGTKEEWKVRLYTDVGGVSLRKEIKVNDNYSGPGIDYALNLHFCIPNQYITFTMFVEGHEEDMWPNPDDSIPQTGIRVINLCALNGEDYEFEPNESGHYLTICKKNSDGKREACYQFEAEYAFD